MMAKKPKADTRVWLPKRTSAFAREVDVALQLVSRGAAAVGHEKTTSPQMATVVAQALVCEGILSEFGSDTFIAPESAATVATLSGDDQAAAVELINELGATTPCVNKFEPPYPDAVKATELSAETLGAALDKGSVTSAGPRTWVLAPVTEVEQPAVSLTLLEEGKPVMCAVACPKLPRNSMSREKLLRMTVSFDGQSGAITPEDGTILWAEENIGAYERSIAGEHGTDVPIRVDRSLLGQRSIATGQCVGIQDFAEATRCVSGPCAKAESLAKELSMGATPLEAGGPFAYGLVARAEAQTYFNLPESAAEFDANIWSHAAGALLVSEAGGAVTDTVGNELSFSDGTTLAPHVTGVLTTNKDLHADVVKACNLAAGVEV